MSENELDKSKRGFLVATSVMSGVAAAGAATPFVASMFPSERAKALGAPVEVDIGKLAPGEMMRVEWRGKPVWIVRRTKEMLESIEKSDDKVTDPQLAVDQQPDYAKNENRSIRPEVLVLEGVCTHLGCSPQFKPKDMSPEMGADWVGGFYCPCHGSKFDFAGRVYKGAPAPTNLKVPPHMYVADSTIVIGEDKKGA
ncbi:MAG: ubiquinol-cytochrome c reductase iron-sulfur subunit [Burkholderiales bacterium]|nr:ubiquinol-cytochrome c reductase iron-sulfur subunit [Burkholderiales bacterium]